MVVEELVRVFKFGQEELPDPNSNLSLEEVKKFYSMKHGELANAVIQGPDYKDNKAHYEFKVSLGNKG